MIAARYFDLIRKKRDDYNHSLRFVESARQRDTKPTARLFATAMPTVRRSLRRFVQHEPSGLLKDSRISQIRKMHLLASGHDGSPISIS